MSAALLQLTGMGIPRPRARAALNRSKGDAMAAAERVFAGEFDDIPSDAEDSDPEEPTGLQTPASNPPEDQDMSNESDFDGDMYEDDAMSDTFDINPRGQDPYAGIFFPMDRVEEIIEPIVDDVFVAVPTEGTSVDVETIPTPVRILGRAEWMSGCPEGGEQSFLFQLYGQLSEREMACSTHGCSHTFPRHPKDFFSLHPDFPTYAAHVTSVMEQECPMCLETTCFACEERCEGRGKGKTPSGQDMDSLLHCSNIQGVIIGVGLHMIEKAFKAELDMPPATLLATSRKRKKLGVFSKLLPGYTPTGEVTNEGDDESEGEDKSVSFPSLTLSGKAASKGTGYSGSHHEDRSGQLRVERAQAQQDKRTAEVLRHVSVYLPSFKREGGTRTSDIMVHPTALAHLRRRSGFVNDLLSSDSLLDMSNRAELYDAVLMWLEVVSNHEALASMLAMPAMRPTSRTPGPDPDSVTVTYCASPSPRELLEGAVIQAEAALKGLSATRVEKQVEPPKPEEKYIDVVQQAPVAEDEQELALKTLCERILAARDKIDLQLESTKGVDFVKRMMDTLPGRQLQTEAILTDDADIEQSYVTWATAHRFLWSDLRNPADNTKYLHFYNDEAEKLNGLDLPRRSVAIAKELSVLAQNVPSSWGASIFLRVDETRVDILKAMIIGPQGTPYANGCFLFDIFLPSSYNVTSPLVHYMTTNGGRYRFNPNLYADGKVCLSLLGTWAGPGWIAGKSTLLQVLLSIQSLILCDEPYLNEPGWANGAGTAASKTYSANVRRMTMIDAMANNIKKPPFPFKDEIRTHFRLKANEIRKQLKEWKALDDGHGVGWEVSGSFLAKPVLFDDAAKELNRLLDGIVEPGEGV